MEEIPGQELSARVLEEGVWLASEMALDEPQILRDKARAHNLLLSAYCAAPECITS